MRMSSLVLPLIMFVGLMVGIQNFGGSIYAGSGVDAEGFESVENQQQQMKQDWTDEGSDPGTFREEQGIVERASGAILVPRIASDVISVGQTMNTILEDVSKSRWVPDWAATMLRSLIGASVFFALVGAYLRYRA